jgi:hypothetical protein
MPSIAVFDVTTGLLGKEGLSPQQWAVILDAYGARLKLLKRLRLNPLGDEACLWGPFDTQCTTGKIGFDAKVYDPKDTGLTLKSYGVFGVIDFSYCALNQRNRGARHLWGITKAGWVHVVVHYHGLSEPGRARKATIPDRVDIFPIRVEELLNLRISYRLRTDWPNGGYIDTSTVDPARVYNKLEGFRKGCVKRAEEANRELAELNADAAFFYGLASSMDGVRIAQSF